LLSPLPRSVCRSGSSDHFVHHGPFVRHVAGRQDENADPLNLHGNQLLVTLLLTLTRASGRNQRQRKIRNSKSKTNPKSEIRISNTHTRTRAASLLRVLDWSVVF
jgi:hypothetical protein